MYTINVDITNNRINMELSGHMSSNELEAYSKDILNIVSQYEKRTVIIIAYMERLDPIAQDSLPICIELLCNLTPYIKKIAFIHKRVITRMQCERIINEVNNKVGGTLCAIRCSTVSEALRFFNEKSPY